ncbi:MAG TPA: alpha/beta hydrolase [Patescibacteria group bacterium]|nr:alpha/beta hydrolase [Patescibacteria group bacterium]
MRQKHISALGAYGFHRVAYTEWGDPANPRVLVCVHGLSRTGRDFDLVAKALADGWRVVCPDMPGRGDSEWLVVKASYVLPTYLSVCAALIARLDVEQVDWLGTSMGGMIGMSLAALPGSPIRRLILNDIGPFLPATGLTRISSAVGSDPQFATLTDAEAYLRQAMATFGITRDEDWRHVAETSTRPAAGGGLRLHYDPTIAAASIPPTIEDISFWPVWDQIRCPTLTLRGEDSDILTKDTAAEMTQRGPKSALVEFPGCGHAPALFEPEQIAVVKDWLGQP